MNEKRELELLRRMYCIVMDIDCGTLTEDVDPDVRGLWTELHTIMDDLGSEDCHMMWLGQYSDAAAYAEEMLAKEGET